MVIGPPERWTGLLVVRLCWCTLAALMALWDHHICRMATERELCIRCRISYLYISWGRGPGFHGCLYLLMPYGVQALASGRCPYLFWCGRAPPIVCNDRSLIRCVYWMYRKDFSICKGNGLTCESKLKLYMSSRAIPPPPRNSLPLKNWFLVNSVLLLHPVYTLMGWVPCCGD